MLRALSPVLLAITTRLKPKWIEELTFVYFMEQSPGGLRGHAQLPRTGRLPPQVRQHLLPLAVKDALLQGLLHQMIDPL